MFISVFSLTVMFILFCIIARVEARIKYIINE